MYAFHWKENLKLLILLISFLSQVVKLQDHFAELLLVFQMCTWYNCGALF